MCMFPKKGRFVTENVAILTPMYTDQRKPILLSLYQNINCTISTKKCISNYSMTLLLLGFHSSGILTFFSKKFFVTENR